MVQVAIPRHLFFYGTLIAGNANPVAARIHAALEPLGRASVRGALHAIPDAAGWFPALLPGGGLVHGALYRAGAAFDGAALARMDAYEDFDPATPEASLYRRAAVAVNGAVRAAEAYLWNRALPPDAVALPGGDFAAWLVESGATVFGGTRSA